MSIIKIQGRRIVQRINRAELSNSQYGDLSSVWYRLKDKLDIKKIVDIETWKVKPDNCKDGIKR